MSYISEVKKLFDDGQSKYPCHPRLAGNITRQDQVNQATSLFFNSIRNKHKDGTLWTRLLSAFHLLYFARILLTLKKPI